MLGRAGAWTGLAIAGLTMARYWYYQDFPAGSGSVLALTGNDNGTGPWDPVNVVSGSAVVTDQNGNPVYTSAGAPPADQVKVASHTALSVVLNGIPDVAYGPVRIWYLYAAISPPALAELAPDFVRAARAEFLDTRFLNAGLNLSDLIDLVDARQNLGFSDIDAGRILLGDGGTLPSSDAELFFKAGLNYLGVGAADPLAPVHVLSGQAELLRLENSASAGAQSWSLLNNDGYLELQPTGAADPILSLSEDPAAWSWLRSGLAVAPGGDTKALVVRGSAGQTQPLQEWQDDSGTALASLTRDGDFIAPNVLTLGLLLEDPGAGTSQVTLLAPTGLASSYDLILPGDNGTAGQVLQNDGNGNTSWYTVPTEVTAGAAGRIGLYNVAGSQISDHYSQNGNPVVLQVASHGALAAARTYSIPDAGDDAEFVMAKAAQTIAGVKTFSGRPVLSSGLDLAGNGHKVTLTPGALAADYGLVLPPSQGPAGSSLVNDGNGNLTWLVPSSAKGGEIPIPANTLSVAIVFGTPRPVGNKAYTPFAEVENSVDTDPQYLSRTIIARSNTGFTVEFNEPVLGSNNVLLWGTIEHANA